MKLLSHAENAQACALFEIPPQGESLVSFFFSEEEIDFILALASGDIQQPIAADSPEIDTALAYHRGLLSKTDETGSFFTLNNFYGFLDVFCVSNYERYQTLPWETRVALDDWYFKEYVKTLDTGSWPPTADRVLPLDEMLEEILADPRPIYLNYCDCRSLTGACGLPRRTCLTYRNGINTFVDRGLSEQIDAERAVEIVRQAERDGLMHTKAMGGICNCCGDCCYLFRAQQALESVGSWPASAWIVSLDSERCIGCGRCVKRCHMQVFERAAARERGAAVSADLARCVGCGICTSSCPSGALTLHKR